MGSVGHRILLLGLGVLLIGLVLVAQRVVAVDARVSETRTDAIIAAVEQLAQDTWRNLPRLRASEAMVQQAAARHTMLSGQPAGDHPVATIQIFLLGTLLVLVSSAVYGFRQRLVAVLRPTWRHANRVRMPHLLGEPVDRLTMVSARRRYCRQRTLLHTFNRPPIACPVALSSAWRELPLPLICDEDLPDTEVSATGTFTSLAVVAGSACPNLSEREREIVRLLAQGYSNPQIAAELTITVLTVKRHLSNIYGKLQVNDRRAAVAYAQHHALV